MLHEPTDDYANVSKPQPQPLQLLPQRLMRNEATKSHLFGTELRVSGDRGKRVRDRVRGHQRVQSVNQESFLYSRMKRAREDGVGGQKQPQSRPRVTDDVSLARWRGAPALLRDAPKDRECFQDGGDSPLPRGD